MPVDRRQSAHTGQFIKSSSEKLFQWMAFHRNDSRYNPISQKFEAQRVFVSRTRLSPDNQLVSYPVRYGILLIPLGFGWFQLLLCIIRLVICLILGGCGLTLSINKMVFDVKVNIGILNPNRFRNLFRLLRTLAQKRNIHILEILPCIDKATLPNLGNRIRSDISLLAYGKAFEGLCIVILGLKVSNMAAFLQRKSKICRVVFAPCFLDKNHKEYSESLVSRSLIVTSSFFFFS